MYLILHVLLWKIQLHTLSKCCLNLFTGIKQGILLKEHMDQNEYSINRELLNQFREINIQNFKKLIKNYNLVYLVNIRNVVRNWIFFPDDCWNTGAILKECQENDSTDHHLMGNSMLDVVEFLKLNKGLVSILIIIIILVIRTPSGGRLTNKNRKMEFAQRCVPNVDWWPKS